MKKVYIIRLVQSFNALKKTTSLRDFLKRIKYEDKTYRHTVYGNYECVYAEDEEDACEIYKKRYPYKDIDYVIDYWYGSGYGDYDYDDSNCVLDKDNPEFSYEVEAQSKEEELTIKELKKYLTGEDFLEFCKDRLHPIETIIDGE